MTDRFKKGDEIKYPNPNADMDGLPKTLTRTLDAHDAAIVNAALEPTYCAECAENGLVLPHPCPRVTVAPLAVTPRTADETDRAEVGGDCQYCDGTGACPKNPLIDKCDGCGGTGKRPVPDGEGPYRPDIDGLIAAIRSGIESAISLAHSHGFTAGQKRELLHIASLEPDPLHEYLTGQEGCSDCAEPPSPDLVAAVRDTLLSVGGDLDPKPEKWYATIGRREFNRLATALQNTPEPDYTSPCPVCGKVHNLYDACCTPPQPVSGDVVAAAEEPHTRVAVRDGVKLTRWECPECGNPNSTPYTGAPGHERGCKRMGYHAYVDYVRVEDVTPAFANSEACELAAAIVEATEDYEPYWEHLQDVRKRLAAAIASSPSQPSKGVTLEGWQPIETVPNGEWVIVADPRCSVDPVYTTMISSHSRDTLLDAWKWTHWMPLPAPPTNPKEQQA